MLKGSANYDERMASSSFFTALDASFTACSDDGSPFEPMPMVLSK